MKSRSCDSSSFPVDFEYFCRVKTAGNRTTKPLPNLDAPLGFETITSSLVLKVKTPKDATLSQDRAPLSSSSQDFQHFPGKSS